MGKTIVGARGRNRELELKRLEERKKLRRRNTLIGSLMFVVGALAIVWVIVGIIGMLAEQEEVVANAGVSWEPTVDIVSEGGGKASDRVNEFVAKVEKDFRDIGYSVERAVLPMGYTREVDIYLIDRVEYYKFSVDRGSAVQTEDAERMMRHLDERGIVAEYVDLRVEGKAYFK